jgi:MarR family transcriptional regulator, 2-MHQ and catechol-resistance regulon repressor
MSRGKTTPEHDGRRGETYVKRLAHQFIERFPESDLAALEITNALNACYNAQRAALSKMFQDLGMAKTLGRSTVIRAISFAGRPLTHNEIGVELEITPGSVTYLVDGLERDGFARRIVDESDRRTVYVDLTATGREVAAKLTPAVADFATHMCDAFTDEEKDQFRELLYKYLDSARSKYISQDASQPGNR